MRWTTIAALGATLHLFPMLGGCGEPSPETKRVQEKLGETLDAMKAWGIDKKDDLLASAAQQLAAMKQKLAEAKQAASGAGSEAAASLEAEWTVVEQRLGELKSATGAQWERARDAYLEAQAALGRKLASMRPK